MPGAQSVLNACGVACSEIASALGLSYFDDIYTFKSHICVSSMQALFVLASARSVCTIDFQIVSDRH